MYKKTSKLSLSLQFDLRVFTKQNIAASLCHLYISCSYKLYIWDVSVAITTKWSTIYSPFLLQVITELVYHRRNEEHYTLNYYTLQPYAGPIRYNTLCTMCY